MDWKGVAVLLQRAAKEYEVYRDANAAVELLQRAEQERDGIATQVTSFRAQRDQLVKEIDERRVGWVTAEKELREKFEAKHLAMTEELIKLEEETGTAKQALKTAQSAYQEFTINTDKRYKVREAEMAQLEAKYAERIKKAEARLAAMKADVASL